MYENDEVVWLSELYRKQGEILSIRGWACRTYGNIKHILTCSKIMF